MPICSNGHDSTWDDYCSDCGVAIGGATADAAAASAAGDDAGGASTATPGADAAAAPTAPTGPSCANCSEPHDVDDVFCESCGYDFLSGSLPDPVAQAPAVVGPESAPPQGHVATTATVRFDRELMQRMVDAGELEYTGNEDLEHQIELTGVKVLIGRASRSRGVFPEIDLSELTQDPAVSSRHAMLMRADDGTWTVNDLGSTNGTYLGDATDALAPGTETALAFDTPLFVGAWTSITLTEGV